MGIQSKQASMHVFMGHRQKKPEMPVKPCLSAISSDALRQILFTLAGVIGVVGVLVFLSSITPIEQARFQAWKAQQAVQEPRK
jgi:hypothetical protein